MSFSFGSGTPSSAPASTGLTGFSFGPNKPATPGFGLTATTQPSTGLFGTPATSAPAFGSGTSTFGATSTAPAFGSSTPAFGSSTPAFGSSTPAFGSSTPAFGSATPAFGATSTAPAFGANTSFGAAATSAPAFGGTTSLSFGATTSAPAFGTTTPAFGTTAPTFGAGNTSFGTGLGAGGLNFGTGTTASTGLSFNTTTTTSAGLGGLGGFGFGATTTTTQSGLGLFGSTTTTSGAFENVNTSGLIPSSAPSLGLGGVAQPGTTNTTTGDGKSEPPKQTKLPNEIATTVESFKEFVKKQKSLSSDVMRVNTKPLHKVCREAESMLRAILALRGECGRSRAQSFRLRAAAAAALAAAETAARDSPGADPEGVSPPTYIKDLIAELEQQLITLRRQIDVADKQMQSTPKLLTEQELTLGIRRMHESLVALAARLQAVHTQVEAQKEQYLNLRKYILKDPSNVFDTPSSVTNLDQILRDAETTRKTTKTGNMADTGLGSAVLSDPRAALGNIQQMSGPTPFTYLGSTLSSFPAADRTIGLNWQPTPQPQLNTSLTMPTFGAAQNDSSFQLQKPPGKRGKQ